MMDLASPCRQLGSRIQELEEENALLRARVETADRVMESATSYAMITLDLDGLITGWNAGARLILGYATAEVLGRSGALLFVPEDRREDAFTQELCVALDRGHAVNERWHVRRDGSRFWASGMMMPLLDGEGTARGFLNILRDGTEAQVEAERRAMLLAEMGHRAKNTLAVVQSVAAQTARHAADLRGFRAAFDERLAALGRSHDVLVHGGWEGARLSDVLERVLTPHDGQPGRLALSGPPVRLGAGLVVTLSLAFHELATNAAKYGALSAGGGRVEVGWALARAPRGGRMVEILWRESGGPPVRPPARRGFGTRLLEHGLGQDLGGTVRLDFAPGGVECRIMLPLGPRLTDAPA